MQLSEQTERDLGSAGYLAGSGLMFDTARTGWKGMESANKLVSLGTRATANPQLLLKAETSIPMLREYAQHAGDLARSRVLGLPAGKWFEKLMPGEIAAGRGMDALKYHLGMHGSLTPAKLNHLRGVTSHYKGFVNNPERTLLSELFTGGADGTDKLYPMAKRIGLTPDEISMVMQHKTHEPMRMMHEMTKLRKTGPNRELDALSGRLARYLMANEGSAGAIRRGVYDTSKAVNFGPLGYGKLSGAISKALMPLGLIGGSVLGSIGARRIFDDHVKIASPLVDRCQDILKNASLKDRVNNWYQHDLLDKPETSEYVTNTGMLGAGVGLMRRGLRYAPSDLITVTAGRLTPPVWLTDVGAGHITPAKGVYEALRSHPAVRNGEFVADMALRQMDPSKSTQGQTFGFMKPRDARNLQLPFELQNQSIHGRNNSLLTLDTGFGATTSHYQMPFFGRSPEFKINPDGRAMLVTDSRDSLDNSFRAVYGNSPYDIHKKMNMYTFGMPNAMDHLKGVSRRAHLPVHPALQDSVLDMAEQRLKGEHNPSAVWTDVLKRMRATGLEESAGKLEEAINAGKHISVITGSSRGDYVAQRIKEIERAMASNPDLADKVHLVGMMGSAYDDDVAKRMLSGTKATLLPNTAKLFGSDKASAGLFDIVNSAGSHWGSTGANAFAEANMSRTPSFFVTNYDDMDKRLEDMLHKDYGIAPKAKGPMHEATRINLNAWNSGTLEEVKQGLRGMAQANSGDEFVGRLRDIIAGKAPSHRSEEAVRYLEQARASKRALADELINLARDIRGKTTGKMVRRLGAGGVMASLGGMGLYDAFSRRNNNLKDVFKERLDRAL